MLSHRYPHFLAFSPTSSSSSSAWGTRNTKRSPANRLPADNLQNASKPTYWEEQSGPHRSTVGYPSFHYRPAEWKRDLPLMNTSSMVSELAPVVLYLRHVVQPGDVLIIEEPESHLHPAMQVAFTRLLAAVARSGVRVVLTTHSEWVLEALANLVRLSEVDRAQRQEIRRRRLGADAGSGRCLALRTKAAAQGIGGEGDSTGHPSWNLSRRLQRDHGTASTTTGQESPIWLRSEASDIAVGIRSQWMPRVSSTKCEKRSCTVGSCRCAEPIQADRHGPGARASVG